MKVRHIHRIIKVGSSHAVVLPRGLMKTLGMKRGDLVVLGCVQEGVMFVKKATTQDIEENNVEIIDFTK